VRKNPVLGEGNPDSLVVFVGEAPGREEDKQGRPFVGSAGKLLDRLLEQVDLRRENIFITNILKCRPPGNRRPRSAEIRSCAKHLEELLEIIAPRIIVPMGDSALGYFMKRFGQVNVKISKVHGKEFVVDAPWGQVVVFPLYHPAAVLYNRRLEKEMERDLGFLKGILETKG
jgi:DNA polymerase